MITHINETVKVGAVFGGGQKIKPVWFMWNERKYHVKEITYSWIAREGRARLYFFSVTDGNTLYEICYNAENLAWKLVATEVE